MERHFTSRTVDNVHNIRERCLCTMIVKKRDAQFEVIQALEAQAESTRDVLKKSACLSAASRLSVDETTQRAAELVDFYFAQREDWAVIHDLRMRVGAHAVHINHVLVYNSLQIVCLDSRYVNCQIEFSRSGCFNAITMTESKLISSPLAKMAKDVTQLKSYLESIAWGPKRFGVKMNADIRGSVLASSYTGKQDLRNKTPGIGIHPSEAYFTTLCERGRFKLLRGGLSSEALFEAASLLAQQHLPIYPSYLLDDVNENRRAA